MKDEEQEWDPAAAEFMARRSRIFQTEAGNDTVGISKRYDDGEDNDAGSEISLLPLYNKGIYAESLFLNFDRPRDGVSVAAQIMAGQARVSGQEWDPDAAEFMARRLRIFQTEYGNTTVGISKQHGDGEDNDAGSEISLLLLYDKGIYADGLFSQFGSATRWCSCRSRNHGGTSPSQWTGILQRTLGLESTQ